MGSYQSIIMLKRSTEKLRRWIAMSTSPWSRSRGGSTSSLMAVPAIARRNAVLMLHLYPHYLPPPPHLLIWNGLTLAEDISIPLSITNNCYLYYNLLISIWFKLIWPKRYVHWSQLIIHYWQLLILCYFVNNFSINTVLQAPAFCSEKRTIWHHHLNWLKPQQPAWLPLCLHPSLNNILLVRKPTLQLSTPSITKFLVIPPLSHDLDQPEPHHCN